MLKANTEIGNFPLFRVKESRSGCPQFGWENQQNIFKFSKFGTFVRVYYGKVSQILT